MITVQTVQALSIGGVLGIFIGSDDEMILDHT
jgi:hypothetical protein